MLLKLINQGGYVVRQSNGYIMVFTLIMTIIVGGVLAGANQLLGPAQQKSIELDTKTQILSAVMSLEKGSDVLGIYENRIQSLVVDINGEEVSTNQKGEALIAEKVEVNKEYKKNYKERLFPVFKFVNENDPSVVDAYIVPVYGAGLWDKIYGFVAINNDMKTIAGVSFGHIGETPGLGARISDPSFQKRFVGKSLFNESGRYVSVTVVKGEAGGGGEGSITTFAEKPNLVDGLSGATLTANGVNSMLKKYLDYYQKYFNKVKN